MSAMEDNSQNGDAKGPKYSAPKDKNCPYCGQAFTSSSLGRHLDLYIKEKNPKPPDGLHDVDEIRKMRGGITRRQPRGSLGGRREVSTPIGTPKASSRKESMGHDRDSFMPSGIPKDGQYAVDTKLSKFPFASGRWEVTGVMNDIGENGHELAKRPGMQRSVSRQAQKAQFDVKHKLSDAMDTARAAELALRELISSWRAAKQQFDANTMPFDFDPLSLDFPALTLQCLQPPPTLFSSTQHPTSTSWSVQCPGQREFEALKSFFEDEFQTWKISCVTANTDAMDELTYPTSNGPYRDKRDVVRKVEKSADHLEKQVNEHLQSAYAVWESLPPQRQNELWILELARGVGRKHKEAEKMKEQQQKLQQENANLKSQIDQLNRLQQPREFKLSPPGTIPFDKEFITHAYEQGLKGQSIIGFSLEDRDLDLSALVARSIDRWKNVVVSSRVVSGMSSQRSLDQTSVETDTNGNSQPSQSRSQSQTPQQQTQPHQPPKRLSTASTNGALSENTAASTNTTAPPSVEETSDQDADAEMEDDDSFAIMNASPIKQQQPVPQPIQQQATQQATLEVPRTRGPIPQQRTLPDQRFLMQNGAGSPVGRTAMNMSRSMPNMNMAMQANGLHADLGMAMQGMRSDGMYME
ncbi:unnamed protein product [Clonostachys rosea f. rosea IK726]|uniref:Uncharacterized protein n=3 Tax=Bionectria ochroleuca TaxID=29856 RepID=A0A0B7K0L7_BIOOC|nr:unnamed protein product [Clonostachys rosea f. rosea IK726]